MYFPTRSHRRSLHTRTHTRRISRGTANNEQRCLSPFVTAVLASMHTSSLAYFSIYLCLLSVLFRSMRSSPSRLTVPIPLYQINLVVSVSPGNACVPHINRVYFQLQTISSRKRKAFYSQRDEKRVMNYQQIFRIKICRLESNFFSQSCDTVFDFIFTYISTSFVNKYYRQSMNN